MGVPCGDWFEAHDATVREAAGHRNTTLRVASDDAPAVHPYLVGGSSAGEHALPNRYQYGSRSATLAAVDEPGREALDRRGVSGRELEVLDAVAEGLTNAEIAARLCVSERTVESHVASLLRKLGARNRVELHAAQRSGSPSVVHLTGFRISSTPLRVKECV